MKWISGLRRHSIWGYVTVTFDTEEVLNKGLREYMDPKRLVTRLGDGNNANDLVRSMVRNNIRRAGPIVITESSKLIRPGY